MKELKMQGVEIEINIASLPTAVSATVKIYGL